MKVVFFPPDGDNKVGADDFLLNHSINELNNLPRLDKQDPVFSTLEEWWKRWQARNDREISSKDLADIDADEGHLPTIVGLAWEAIIKANEGSPLLFRRGCLCRLEYNDNKERFLNKLNEYRCQFELSVAANFFRFDKNGKKLSVFPPIEVVKAVLATPNPPLPVLKGIASVPSFDLDGNLQQTPGYNPKTETYLEFPKGLSLQALPEFPTTKDIEEAKNLISELFYDFPFEDAPSRAIAWALALLPSVRNMIDGPTPLHGIDATTAGTGKGLLTACICSAFVGTNIAVMPETGSEEEMRKGLLATLMMAPQIVSFDNLKRRLESASLESVLTTGRYADRILGNSEIVSVTVNTIWVATGNNLTASTEMARRLARCRLNANVERPWLRDAEQFKHADLKAWVMEHRGELIRAALTLVRAWIVAGRPKWDGPVLGSYDEWSKIMGSILNFIGIDGFLSNLNEFYNDADVEHQSFSNFVKAWNEKFPFGRVTAGDLFKLAVDAELPLGRGNERSMQTQLGLVLRKMKGRIFNNLVIEKGGLLDGCNTWQLEEARPF